MMMMSTAAVITVRAGNTNADGVKTVSFTATDRVGNESEVATASDHVEERRYRTGVEHGERDACHG